jgi:hypothetical protein
MSNSAERPSSLEEIMLMDDIDEAFQENAEVIGIVDEFVEQEFPPLMVLEAKLDELVNEEIELKYPRIRLTRVALSMGPEATTQVQFLSGVGTEEEIVYQMILPRDFDSNPTGLDRDVVNEHYEEEFLSEEENEEMEWQEYLQGLRFIMREVEWDKELSCQAAASIVEKTEREYTE